MLASRGQENVVHARPTAGKALAPKTPSNFQTPRTTNRAPLGAKTTNAKAQTGFKDNKNGKLQVFQTPAPNQQRIKPEKTGNRPSTTRRSERSKITVDSSKAAQADVVPFELEDDEPDFGYAPPPAVELPDPPMEFGYDETFPQFRPENMFRGYGEIYLRSPRDKNGFSIRLQKEEEEHRKHQEQQEQELLKKAKEDMSKRIVLSDDEFDTASSGTTESRPNTLKSKSAASALSGMKAPSVASKQTASSRLKVSQPVASKKRDVMGSRVATATTTSRPKPLAVSRNTIGFPKAKKPPSIIPAANDFSDDDQEDLDSLAREISDFEFTPLEFDDDDDDVFQLPTAD